MIPEPTESEKFTKNIVDMHKKLMTKYIRYAGMSRKEAYVKADRVVRAKESDIPNSKLKKGPMRTIINYKQDSYMEDAPTNSVGGGAIAGTVGEPPVYFAGTRVFDVDRDKFNKSRFGKKKHANYRGYVGKDSLDVVRKHVKENPGNPILLRNKDGAMQFLRRPALRLKEKLSWKQRLVEGIIYHNPLPKQKGADDEPFNYHKQDATHHYLIHFGNSIRLKNISRTTKNFDRKMQAEKEIEIARKKMDHWQKHKNYDHEQVMKVIPHLKRKMRDMI